MDAYHDQRGEVPAWRGDLQAQILLRNVMEEKPTQGIFASYMLLHERARRLQTVEKEHQRLTDELMRARARVHELEKAAADVSVRTARELELERKCDDLQQRVHQLMEKENVYYKGLAEVSESRAAMSALETRAHQAESALDRRLSELNLAKKECISMRDENSLLRSRIADAERAIADARKYITQVAQLKLKGASDEQEIASLRSQVAAYQSAPANLQLSSGPEGSFGGASSTSSFTANATNTVPSRSVNASSFAAAAATASPSSLVAPYPRGVGTSIVDAHHGSPIHALCVSQEGRSFVSAGSDKQIRIWNSSSATESKHFSSGGLVMSLHASARHLIAGCADHTVRLWDVTSLRGVELNGHEEKVVSACLGGSGNDAYSASSDGTIKLWDVTQRICTRTFLCMSTSNDVTVSGDVVFSAHYNGDVVMWDRRTGRSLERVRAHDKVATCVRVTTQGRYFVSLGRDNTISVRDMRAAAAQPLRKLAIPQLVVPMNWSRLAISADEKVCAVGSKMGEVSLVTLHEHDEVVKGDPVLRVLHDEQRVGRNKSVISVAWAQNISGPLLSFGEGSDITMWT